MPQFVAPDSNQLLAALHALENEKGRGAALMAAAWVDDSLRSWLEAYLARDSRIAKGLLGPDQPLGSFGGKIKVAYLLGLIDDEMRADADVIRSVRNDFAHFRSRISWSDRSVVDRCRRLQTAKAFDRLTLGRTRSPRQRFLISAFLLSNFCLSMKQFAVPPRAIAGYWGYVRFVGKRLGMDRLRKALGD